MATLHIENTVRDFDAWKAPFDKYVQFRAANGVQSCRLTRSLTQPNKVLIDLDFDAVARAQAFIAQLTKIWASPQSQRELIGHATPEVYELVVTQTLVAS